MAPRHAAAPQLRTMVVESVRDGRRYALSAEEFVLVVSPKIKLRTQASGAIGLKPKGRIGVFCLCVFSIYLV